jgi:two-component system, NtrC family, sensor kinase
LALFLGVMALAALVSVRWARSIFAPVERMNDTMLRVQHGEASARVGATAAADEIGLLARHLDELLDAIDQKTLALEDWGHSLDRKVADRTHELAQANASLRRAHEQLTRSEKLAAVGQLTASIAHEINNPIAVIQGNLDLLRDTLGPAALPCIEEFRLLDAQVERMRLIVTQLLQYARPTEFAGYVETLDANQVVRDSLVLVSHLLGSQRVVVEHHLCARQRIGINRQELQQVLINLLINAIAAMPGGGRLVLSSADGLLPAPGSPGWVQLTVQDTGTGFAPLMRERLFQPFQTTKSDGNGLGLWISQSLLERYGARITAANVQDTEPGQPGARIVLHLWCEPQIPDESSASTNNGRLDTKKL